MVSVAPRISIPMINGRETAEFFPDEIPSDVNDLVDVLRSELAPFRVWRYCAIEYRRQGLDDIFDAVLNEIVVALEDPNVDKIYREREDYAEGLTEIYVALAAKSLCELSKLRSVGTPLSADVEDAFAKKIKDYLSKAEEKLRLNEYTWLIKGFYVMMVNTDVKRAEELFRAVHDRATKGQNQLKKKYLFGSLLGLGMVAHARQKYQVALDHFTKAILANPACSGTVRMAVVSCCFKLEQYDRAKAALTKAIALEPTNSNVIVSAALLELALAKQKDRSKHVDNIKLSYEYCRLALAVDSTNPMALNMLANHYFHAWTTFTFVDGCYLLDRQHLLFPKKAAVDVLRSGDKLIINGDKKCSWSIVGFIQDSNMLPFKDIVTRLCGSVVDWTDFLVVQIAVPTDSTYTNQETGIKVTTVELKELNKVAELSRMALGYSNLSSLRAECYFTIGKVHHTKGELNEAFNCYLRALQESPELTLAAFGAAQIYFSRSKFADALELFEKVLAKSPEDKDTQAYVMLLKAMNKGIATPYEKLREIAPGFKFEIDLWLLQGQLKQKVSSEYPTALKCFQHAKECIEQQYGAAQVPSVLYLNISVLQHSLGRSDKALEFAKQALTSLSNQKQTDEEDCKGAIYNNAEFDGVFYKWLKSALCYVKRSPDNDVFVFHSLSESGVSGSVDFSLYLKEGDEVVIADIKHIVKNVTSSQLVCYSPVKLSNDSIANYPLYLKTILNNFNEDTVTYCYNYARLLEDLGKTKAASEIYMELLKSHPSFMECYLRLSLISSDMGRLNDAQIWLNRALEINNEQPDATICLGDLHCKKGVLPDAKKCYDKICATSRHDARSMLSLGNYYFSGGSSKSETRLKDSYKFFYHVLNEDSSNIYAANGLGMVCAEKGELDAAKDIFSKTREANKSDDTSCNLANVLMTQGRIVDAERIYQTTYNNFNKTSGEAAAMKSAALLECVSYAQMKQLRFEESVRSIQKAIYMQPNDLKLWYNLAVISKYSASAVSKKTQKTSAEIEDAKQDLFLANGVFEYVYRSLVAKGKLTRILKVETVQVHLASCKEKLSALESQLQLTLIEESKKSEDRAKQQMEHEMRIRIKLEEKEQALRAEEAARREKQMLAAQKQAKLAELQEKWVVSEVSQTKAKGGAGGANGKRKKKGDKSGDDVEDDILEGRDDEDDDKVNHFDKKIDQSTYEGAIDFGSSSEDEGPVHKSAKTQLDIDLFGSDDSDDEAAVSNKRKAVVDDENGGVKRKRLTKSGDGNGSDSDDLNEVDDGVAQTAPVASSGRRTIDSDEE